MILFLVLLGLGLLAPIQAQVQLVVVREGEFKELSSTCVAVLNQQVNCDALLKPAGERSVSGIRHFYDVDELEKLCTSGCKRDLSNWQRRIAGACAGAYVKAGNGISVLVDSWPELFVEIYNSICLRDSYVTLLFWRRLLALLVILLTPASCEEQRRGFLQRHYWQPSWYQSFRPATNV